MANLQNDEMIPSLAHNKTDRNEKERKKNYERNFLWQIFDIQMST